MCVIIHLDKKKTLPKQLFQNCYDNNSHGWGIMWAKNNKLVSVKEVSSFDQFWKVWHDVPRDAERAVHFRIMTHGERNQANCHPFFPADNVGLMHNGVIDCNIVEKKMSDTYNFAEYELKPLLKAYRELGKHPFDDQAWLDLVADLGGGSRLLFMDNAGNVIKTTEKSWVDRYGCLFSNGHSLTARYSSSTGYSSRGSRWTAGTRWNGKEYVPIDDDYSHWPYEDDVDYNPHATGTTKTTSTVQVHDNTTSISDTTKKDTDWREGRPANAYKDIKDVSGPISDLYAGNKTDEEGQAALAEIEQQRKDEIALEGATKTEGMDDDSLTKAIDTALRNLTPAHPTDDEDIEDEDTGLDDTNLILEIEDVLVLDGDKLYEFVVDYPASAACTIRALADTCITAGITALTYPLGKAVEDEKKRAEG